MPNYRRIHASGGTFFFTVVTNERLPVFSSDSSVMSLISVIEKTRNDHPFEEIAYCILPDHLRCIWKLPENDSDFSIRWQKIKARFTIENKPQPGMEGDISDSRRKKRERGIWQRRFWEHTIIDESDLVRHINYIHFNPIKHGLVKELVDWRWTSFHKYLKDGYYDEAWGHIEPLGLEDLGNLE
jgi:putative transposase